MNEWRTTAEWDWVWVGNGDRLHAVATLTNNADKDWYGKGMTECGLVTDYMHIPGIFERMSAQRCKHCCAKVGMPQGNQSPKNVDECRPIAEARIDALNVATEHEYTFFEKPGIGWLIHDPQGHSIPGRLRTEDEARALATYLNTVTGNSTIHEGE